jgi:hypothetical protein
MRLLYVCSDFGIPPGGTKGASVHLRAITSALGDLEHDVRLLSPLADHASGLSVPALTPAGLTPVHDSAKRLRTWLEEHGHDAAVAKELRALSYGALAAKAAWERGAPTPSLSGSPC